MSTIGIVGAKETSKNGKPKICIDGKWYFAGRCDVSSLQPGQRIDFTWNTFGSDPAKPLRGIESWGLTPNQPTPEEAAAAQQSAERKPWAGKGGGFGRGQDRDLEIDLQCMRFVGQVVGTAIEATQIVEPQHIAPWVQAAYEAIKFAKTLGGIAPAPASTASTSTSAGPTPSQSPQGGGRVRPTGNFGFGTKYKDTPWNVMQTNSLTWFRDNSNSPDVRAKCVDELWFREEDARAAANQQQTSQADPDFSDDIPF